MFEQTRQTQFRPSEHPEKTSNNKKLLHIIQKKLISAFIEGVWFAQYSKRLKSKMAQQQLRNDHFLMHLPNYSSQSIQPWASARKWILP